MIKIAPSILAADLLDIKNEDRFIKYSGNICRLPKGSFQASTSGRSVQRYSGHATLEVFFEDQGGPGKRGGGNLCLR